MKSEEPDKSKKPIFSEIIKKRKNEPWEAAGLSQEPFDEKTICKDPQTSRYIKSPVAKTLEDLMMNRW